MYVAEADLIHLCDSVRLKNSLHISIETETSVFNFRSTQKNVSHARAAVKGGGCVYIGGGGGGCIHFYTFTPLPTRIVPRFIKSFTPSILLN